MSSGSKKWTQIYYPFLSQSPGKRIPSTYLHTVGCGLVRQGCGGCHMTEFCVFVELMFRCVLCAVCNCCSSVTWQTVRNRICFKFCFDLEKTPSETCEMLNNAVVMMTPWVLYQSPRGIDIWKVAKFGLRILNIHIAACQVRPMKLWEKHESSVRINSGQLMFVTLR